MEQNKKRIAVANLNTHNFWHTYIDDMPCIVANAHQPALHFNGGQYFDPLTELGVGPYFTGLQNSYDNNTATTEEERILDNMPNEEGFDLVVDEHGGAVLFIQGKKNLQRLAEAGVNFPGHELYASKERSMAEKYARRGDDEAYIDTRGV